MCTLTMRFYIYILYIYARARARTPTYISIENITKYENYEQDSDKFKTSFKIVRFLKEYSFFLINNYIIR